MSSQPSDPQSAAVGTPSAVGPSTDGGSAAGAGDSSAAPPAAASADAPAPARKRSAGAKPWPITVQPIVTGERGQRQASKPSKVARAAPEGAATPPAKAQKDAKAKKRARQAGSVPADRPAEAATAAKAAKSAGKVAKKTVGKPAKAAKDTNAGKAARVSAAKTVKPMPPTPKAAAGRAAKPAAAPAPAAAPVAAPRPHLKEKLVRDSFTMPRSDFALIVQLKERALGFRHEAKKSELLRAGLHALAAMDAPSLQALLTRLPKLKSGRPRKAG